MADHPDLAGYVIVTFDSEGETVVHYDCGPIKPVLLPACVGEALSRKVWEQDSQEAEI
ncbi:hypothetical protein [Hyphomicrobium sp. ghe19]|uniref:hypothetical protein n=1 Tax=Hyphomicrobium sp. ghe19 TaxID=2682968 RepID=UPI0030D00D07